MRPCILFRPDLETEEEHQICQQHIHTETSRLRLHYNSLVVGRYSVLPFYQDLEKDIELAQCRLVNTYEQHQYVAKISNWYPDLQAYTPKTWFTWGNDLPEGQYVVKGETNSRKFEWNRRMFAPNKAAIRDIVHTLLDDSLVKDQGLCVRQYVPLETYDIGINGMRFSNEWRCFFYQGELLAHGYYWSLYDGQRMESLPEEAFVLLRHVAKIVKDKINFWVVDIARTESGEWVVIELNDGQMSGLSCVDPHLLYAKLSNKLRWLHEETSELPESEALQYYGLG